MRARPLVALGGGRVIDVAKAIGFGHRAPVAAIPTTMSGAEMTGDPPPARRGRGRARGDGAARAGLADPVAMTARRRRRLRASSMNALAHGADSLYTPFANPVSEMTALRGAELIAAALDQGPDARDRAALALGSILCGYAIDSAGFGLHHVVCQTLVRVCGTPHAETNAAILPHALAFLAERAPEVYGRAGERPRTDTQAWPSEIEALGRPSPSASSEAMREARQAIEAMLRRPELQRVPGPAPTREDLERLVLQAWR